MVTTPVNTAVKLNKAQTDGIVGAIQHFYFSENPAPKNVIVDLKTVRPDRYDPNYACAKVVIESDYIPRKLKSHTVHIRFKMTDRGRLIPATIGYIGQ